MSTKRTVATVGITIGVMAVLGVAGFFIGIYSGVYDVAATTPHYRITEWVLSTAMDHSVAAHAKRITPPQAALEAKGRAGFQDFENLCVICHGAPGVEASEIGKGLNPAAPELSEAASDLSLSAVYWVAAHGIKATGMPAFQPSKSDEDLWQIAAFVKRLSGMSAKDYENLRQSGSGASNPGEK